MAKTLLAFVVLAGVISADAKNQAKCALNGARAVDDMLDSAVYIMASITRCDKANGGDDIRCALDISSSIQSITGMVNVILKAVDKCGDLKTENKKCGLAVGVLIEGWAGLSAASAGIVAKCPNELNGGVALDTVGQAMTNAAASTGAANNNLHGNQMLSPIGEMSNLQGGASFGQCLVNVKGTMKALFKFVKRVMTVKHNCKHAKSKHCAHNSLKIMASLVGFGEFLSGAIGKCTTGSLTDPAVLNQKRSAICAQYSMKLVHALGVADRASVQMSKECKLTHDQRLYLEQEGDEVDGASETSNSLTLALAALLPISAVLSFVAGKRFAKLRVQPERDCEALMAVEE